MSGGELFLLFLGPVLALVAGLIIYAIGAHGTPVRQTVRAGAGGKEKADRR